MLTYGLGIGSNSDCWGYPNYIAGKRTIEGIYEINRRRNSFTHRGEKLHPTLVVTMAIIVGIRNYSKMNGKLDQKLATMVV